MHTKEVDSSTRQQKCRFCHRFMGKAHNESHCVVNGWENENVKIVTADDCETCEKYDSKYIEYPITINGIRNSEISTQGLGHECGSLCEISPCGEEYNGKSYIGIYLGDLPIALSSSFNKESGILTNSVIPNPAILVPELKKIIYGCESWWREIKTVDDFKGISKSDIENTWYVRLLKQLNS